MNLTPVAIAMWDFSWLERRWPGAGFEDWDQALDELAERGYNAVRIDAYPHLVAENPLKEWTLIPVWDQQAWGSPDINKVCVQPALKEVCEIGVKKAISTGQWVAIATSNFCGPQFVGMWRDIAWHRRLTQLIRCSSVGENLPNNPRAQKLFQRF